MHRVRLALPHVIERLTLGLLVVLAGWAAAPPISAAQEISIGCTEHAPVSESFIRCVRAIMEHLEKDIPIDQAVLAQPLRGLLEQVAKAQPYRGAAADLDEFKRRSLELKRDPVSNRDAITVLDNAIASHADEIRAAISTQAIAAQASPGTNIHPDFVKQKLAFLASDRARFYDRGPFEMVRRSLLATALEEDYFLERVSKGTDNGRLRSAILVLDELMDRYTRPQAYPHLSIRQRNSQINTHLFWRASLLFALGEKSDMVSNLRDLVLNNRQFGLETREPGHVYIYRVFSLPYEMRVQPDLGADGGRKIEINDPGLLKRYYNPAQLALAACAHIDIAGLQGIQKFIRAVSDLRFNDYYVVVGTADDPTKLQQLEAMVHRTFDDKTRRKLSAIVTTQAGEFPTMIRHGAKSCGIDDTVLNDIYSSFEFRSEIKRIERPENKPAKKQDYYLLLAGRLNETQARTISEFLNTTLLSPLKLENAYIARMRIDQ